MKAGSAIAILAVVGYLGFEGYAFSKASHRMQPDYIYDLLVRAQTATAGVTSGQSTHQGKSCYRATRGRARTGKRWLCVARNEKTCSALWDLRQQNAL